MAGSWCCSSAKAALGRPRRGEQNRSTRPHPATDGASSATPTMDATAAGRALLLEINRTVAIPLQPTGPCRALTSPAAAAPQRGPRPTPSASRRTRTTVRGKEHVLGAIGIPDTTVAATARPRNAARHPNSAGPHTSHVVTVCHNGVRGAPAALAAAGRIPRAPATRQEPSTASVPTIRPRSIVTSLADDRADQIAMKVRPPPAFCRRRARARRGEWAQRVLIGPNIVECVPSGKA